MNAIITNIGQLVTPVTCSNDSAAGRYDLRVAQDTEVFIRNGRIVEPRSNTSRSNCRLIDAKGGVVIPGLVDPFWMMPSPPAWLDERDESSLSYKSPRQWSHRMARWALRTGVTTLEIKGQVDDDYSDLATLGYLRRQESPHVLATLQATLPPDDAAREANMASFIGAVIPATRRHRWATFFDLQWRDEPGFADQARTLLRAASGAGLRLKLHAVADSLTDAVIRLALDLSVVSIACASHLSPEAAVALARADVVPVFLPCLHSLQPGEGIDVRSLIEHGLPAGVGSGYSQSKRASASMWTAMCAAKERMNLSLSEVLVMCTINNALALEAEHDVGSIEAGKRADLLILDLLDYRELEATLDSPPISSVVAQGRLIP